MHFRKLIVYLLLMIILKQENFSHLIISDIDSIFLDINYLIEYVKNVKTIAAIDYYPDNYLKKGFQK